MKPWTSATKMLVVLGAFTLVLGCAGGPPASQVTLSFQEQQIAAAKAANSRGDLARALRLWRTVLPLDPSNDTVRNAIQSLESQIAKDTEEAVAAGEAAYAQGNIRSGDRWMLEALALQPGNMRALKALRQSVSDASHARQEEKIASAYEGLAKKEQDEAAATANSAKAYLDEVKRLFDDKDYAGVVAAGEEAPPSVDSDVNVFVHNAHIALAVAAYKAGQTERQLEHIENSLATAGSRRAPLSKQALRLRTELSDDSYKRGLALMKTNLDGAIIALEDAVRFRPENIAAKEKLDQATTLQRNLQKIRAN
ncbi:MAG: hypothetical protein AB8B57_02275 [Congregibacter sp.]